MTSTDWSAWHEAYERTDSSMPARLHAVREHIAGWLDRTTPTPVRVVSACAGDGRDLLGVLANRDDADRVTATLVEYGAALAGRARAAADLLAADVEVRCADAGRSDTFTGAVPADLVLLCGIFGNISDQDVQTTVEAASQLARPGACVVWTRHRRDPDLTPSIREWLTDAGWEELAFVSPGTEAWAVGVARLSGPAGPLRTGERWFTFVR